MSEEMVDVLNRDEDDDASVTSDYLTVYIADQIFGFPVLQVQDVLSVQRLTTVPLAPREVAGVLNLRGRIVTAIDVRTRLGFGPKEGGGRQMSVVVEHKKELYSLLIDRVGDVLSLPEENFEGNPPTLDPQWKELSNGIFRLEKNLLVILDVSKIIENLL